MVSSKVWTGSRSRDLIAVLICVGLWSAYGWAGEPAAGEPAAAEPAAAEREADAAEPAAVEREADAGGQYSGRELETEIYQVSHIEAKLCLDILKALGYCVGPPEGLFSLTDLPAVFALSDTEVYTVVGTGEDGKFSPATDSSPQQRLMLVYHRSQTAELVALKRLLTEKIDVPCRQVLIEALVIELSEEASRELGMEYAYSGSHGSITFQPDETAGVSGLVAAGRRLYGAVPDPRAFSATLRAVIDDQKAEVLSSPSVLTLDGRQARITIAEDVPIIKTTTVTGGTTTVDVEFKEVGITLNIKPRVSRDSLWVTLQVQTEVSEAPREDYLMVEDLRVAPLINRRKVETIASIKNNTPFIIGGLIRNEKGETVERLPLLSLIPLIGPLFQVRTDRNEKREVIIVLTPRVIETEGPGRPIQPKDSARFDFLDNRLFRNSYRLKSEDIFDLGFITGNAEVQSTFRRARAFLDLHPEYGNQPPFDVVRAGGVPGEESIVVRMIYEVAKKLELHEGLEPERMIYFVPDSEKPAGFRVTFLHRALTELAEGRSLKKYLRQPYPKKVLFLRYELHPAEGAVVTAPVATPEVRLMNSRKEAEQAAYEYNKLDGYRRTQAAIMIADEGDVERLKAAIAVREVVVVNNVAAILNLVNFQVGRRIVIPQLDPSGERVFLIDAAVADYFFQSDFYYAAFLDRFRSYYEGIQEFLDQQDR